MRRKYHIKQSKFTNMLVRFTFGGNVVFLVLFAISQSSFSDNPGNTSIILKAISGFGFGICIATFSIICAYYAWVLDAISFMDWTKEYMPSDETIFDPVWAQWYSRFISPIFAIFGLGMAVFSIFSFLEFFLGD